MSIAQLGSVSAALTEDRGASPFRAVIRKPTPFALENARYEFQPTPRFGFQTSCLVPRNGDLLTGATLELTLKQLLSVAPNSAGAWYPAEVLVQELQLVVGGTIVERIPGEYLRMYDAFHRSYEGAETYKAMTNFDPAAIAAGAQKTQVLRLPLPFTFARHWGSALPLLCMPNTEVRINVTLRDAVEAGVDSAVLEAALDLQYAYLGEEERGALVSADQDILVEQIQWETFDVAADSTSVNARLNFSKPVKSLYWALKNTTASTATRTHAARYIGDAVGTYQAFTESALTPSGLAPVSPKALSEHLAPVKHAKIVWGGQERTAGDTQGSWFRLYQSQRHGKWAKKTPPPGMYMFSFALDPESLDPTGYANFAAVEDVRLALTLKKSVTTAPQNIVSDDEATKINECTLLLVFARGYNVLKVPRAGGRVSLLWG